MAAAAVSTWCHIIGGDVQAERDVIRQSWSQCRRRVGLQMLLPTATPHSRTRGLLDGAHGVAAPPNDQRSVHHIQHQPVNRLAGDRGGRRTSAGDRRGGGRGRGGCGGCRRRCTQLLPFHSTISCGVAVAACGSCCAALLVRPLAANARRHRRGRGMGSCCWCRRRHCAGPGCCCIVRACCRLAVCCRLGRGSRSGLRRRRVIAGCGRRGGSAWGRRVVPCCAPSRRCGLLMPSGVHSVREGAAGCWSGACRGRRAPGSLFCGAPARFSASGT